MTVTTRAVNRIDGISERYLFESGSAANGGGDDILITLAHELGATQQDLRRGAYRRKADSQNSSYTNWELSADRVNATRRLFNKRRKF
jgi:hypothetical protein